MFQVTREFTFAFAHRLLQAAPKERRLHGHNGKIRVTLAGAALNSIGMVMDFVEMKQHIGQWLDEHFDHATLLQHDDPLASVLQAADQRVYLTDAPPTPEYLAQLVFDRCHSTGLPVVEVTMWEAPHRYATYRPT